MKPKPPHPDLSLRRRQLLIATCGLPASAAWAQSAAAPSGGRVVVDDAARWAAIHRSIFGGQPIEAAPPELLRLDAPARAVDGAFVPVGVRTGDLRVRQLTLVIDSNPAPVAAVFEFGSAAGRPDIETRLRIDEYTMVRAIVELADAGSQPGWRGPSDSPAAAAAPRGGRLLMATRFVKASGGCSAPAGADAAAAAASLGRMQLRADAAGRGQPTQAQWQISHPNHTGLALDQVSRLYVPQHYVRSLDIAYDSPSGTVPVLRAELDFALSENPALRFQFTPPADGRLRAEAEDTRGQRFATSLPVQAG